MTHLQWVYKQDDRRNQWQEKYYQMMLEQEEGVRRLRHDMKNHFYGIHTLCSSKEYDKLQVYVENLISTVEKYSGIHTGNNMADCFLNTALEELKEQGELDFQLVGHFPEKLYISDMDFCVIFSNAVDNAKEALSRVQGKRFWYLEIKSYQERIYITMINSMEPDGKTGKNIEKDKKLHGYGVGNMRLMAEKYGGGLEITKEKGRFRLDIKL